MTDDLFWKKYFEVYDILNFLIPYQKLLGDILGMVDINKGDKIFDAGAGTGNLSFRISKIQSDIKIVGMDSSASGLEIFKSKIPNAEIIVGDITKPLPFQDKYFDKIFSNNVIYTLSVDKRKSVILEFKRILKDDGVLVLSNITTDFKPLKIYYSHIGSQIKRDGYLKTIKTIFLLILPTIKMFYYNSVIRKNDKTGKYSFLQKDEQRKLMEDCGFKVETNMYSYAGQAVINKGIKI